MQVSGSFRRVWLVLTAGMLSACWLTSSFDSLVAQGGTDGGNLDTSPLPDAQTDSEPQDGSPDSSSHDTGPQPDGTTPAEGGDAPAEASPSDAGCVVNDYVMSVQADTPVAYWRLDETSGSTAADLTGQHNGTYSSGVTLGATGIFGGAGDKAASFDGDGGLVTIGQSVLPFTGTASFTLEAWINPSLLTSEYRGIVSNEIADTMGRQGYLMYVHLEAGVGFERWANGASDPVIAAGTGTGVWDHLVGVYDAQMATVTLYVDGNPATPVNAPIAIAPNIATLVIGALFSGMTGTNFAGVIDEVAIYDHALSARCIQAHYHLGTGQLP